MATPFLDNLQPPAGAQHVEYDTNIYLEVKEASGDVDDNSIIIEINGKTALQNDAAQSGFAVGKAVVTNGFSYTDKA